MSPEGPRFFTLLLFVLALAEVLPYVRHHVVYVLGTYDPVPMTDLRRRSTDFATDMSLGRNAMSDGGYALGV